MREQNPNRSMRSSPCLSRSIDLARN